MYQEYWDQELILKNMWMKVYAEKPISDPLGLLGIYPN